LLGFVTSATGGLAVGIFCGAVTTVAGALAGGLFEVAAPTDLTKAVSPAGVLARDRMVFVLSLILVIPLVVAGTLNATFSPPDPVSGNRHGWGYGLGIGASGLVAVGLSLAFYQARWGEFTLARWWLAASGRLPLRLMSFLHDAHVNRGVLRQAGAVYQFRHVELQRRLAASADTKTGASPDSLR
jgi:hypothetical protein